MLHFSENNIFILPHAEEYRDIYNVTIDEIVQTLNEPDVHEGVSEDRYTVEKQFGKRRVYIYYYLTLPLQNRGEDDACAVIDFVSAEDEPEKK